MNYLREKIYKGSAHFRDKAFRPLAMLLTVLRIKPNHVTILGAICMVAFIFILPHNINAAILLLAVAIIVDLLDGVLARYQKLNSDKGKFIDVLVDNVNASLYIVALGHAEFVGPELLIIYVYLMLLSKVFRVFLNSFEYPSNWHFHAVAGLIPNLINGFAYGMMVFFAWTGPSHITEAVFIIACLILFMDVIFHLGRILAKERAS